ncbi:hypothetical protein D7D25_08395 [Proteiniphilum sp. X52]|nr:hypothetical protein D7D25_08395 [Proteiniphilum sp. X52]
MCLGEKAGYLVESELFRSFCELNMEDNPMNSSQKSDLIWSVFSDTRSDRGILNGLGKLMDEDMKKFVRTKLLTETISLLRFYKEFPILA